MVNAYSQCLPDMNTLWQVTDGIRHRESSYDRSGANIDAYVMKPDEKFQFCNIENKSGIIQRIWFTFSSEDPLYLQKLRLNIEFDGENNVVDVPIGMFFVTGPWRVNDIVGPVVNVMRSNHFGEIQEGVGYGSFNMLFPMPFVKNVKMSLQNNLDSEVSFFYYVDWIEKEHETSPLLFHATYNETPLTKVSCDTKHNKTDMGNYVFLDVNNMQGNYVGTVLCVESLPQRLGKWYEGDDMFVIDGNEVTLHGTGTEDYFSMAWGYHRPYQGFDHGVSHFEKKITSNDRFYDGRFVTYRFHLVDPIIFKNKLRASIEAGHANDCNQHYESVAFWYGKKN